MATTNTVIGFEHGETSKLGNMSLGKRKRGGEAEGSAVRAGWGETGFNTMGSGNGTGTGVGSGSGTGIWGQYTTGASASGRGASPKSQHQHHGHGARHTRLDGTGGTHSTSNPWTHLRTPSSSSWAISDRPTKQARRLLNPSAKNQKPPTLAKLPSHLMDIVAELPSSSSSSSISSLDISNADTGAGAGSSSHHHHAATTTTTATSDLRPCHICHKAPTRKRDLEAYIQCTSCGERACYVCTRVCVGARCRSVWDEDGKRKALLCSLCCVEVGREGDVLCRGCFVGGEGL